MNNTKITQRDLDEAWDRYLAEAIANIATEPFKLNGLVRVIDKTSPYYGQIGQVVRELDSEMGYARIKLDSAYLPLYIMSKNVSIISMGKDAIPKTTCAHNFAVYQGLHDIFEYCTMCDEKRK